MEDFSDRISNLLLAAAMHLRLARLVDDKAFVRSSARGVGEGLLNTRWELFRAGPCLRPLIRVEAVRLPEETRNGKLQVRVVYDNDLNPWLWRRMLADMGELRADGHGHEYSPLGHYTMFGVIGLMLRAPARSAFRMALADTFCHSEPTIEIVEERKLPD